MSGIHLSPFRERMRQKLLDMGLGYKPSGKEMMILERAFVEALKEEVGARWKVGYEPGSGIKVDANAGKPLVIAGLGSFKMKTRPQRWFCAPHKDQFGESIRKPAARRLVFKSKWEEIK